MSDEQQALRKLKHLNQYSLLLLAISFLFFAVIFFFDVSAPNPWFSILSISAFTCMIIGIGISGIQGILAIKAVRKYKCEQFKLYRYPIMMIIIGLIFYLVRSFIK
ncbi:hypothetical protein KBI51_04065 [Aerococcaceae bacterium zg-ZUI334]|uniref:hypothetical protein n=1 Tax=Aerococcaceae bacterium zg-252 TaxID=2796928 RepID=UPI001B996B0E|nr:hypothetical protein [Aerococcaceae bacterium zg-ZUI334]